MTQENLDKLRLCRNGLAAVYKDEATDETYDNGNLTTLNNALLCVEIVIKAIANRLGQEE